MPQDNARAFLAELFKLASKKMPIRTQAGFSLNVRYAALLSSLRVVLEAANERREQLDEQANDPRTLCDEEDRKKCDALAAAIAELEPETTRPASDAFQHGAGGLDA